MTGDHFESALSSLMKEQEKNRLLKILNEIRKGVEGSNRKENVKKLFERGCLGHVIKKLQEPHLDVISFALSILGYCCMERASAREAVIKYNLLLYLNHLLKHYKQDSIQGRIFRIIGNLCHHWDRLANIVIEKEKQLHIITKLVAAINKFVSSDENDTESIPDEDDNQDKKSPTQEVLWRKTSEGTITMALRALNKLLNSGSVMVLVEDCQVIKALGSLLIKFTPVWERTKMHEDILKTTLTLIFEYSIRYQHYNVIKQLHTTSKGNALEYLEKLVSLNPLLVIKLSVTLGEVQKSKSDIPFAEISRSFIVLLQDPTIFNFGRADPRYGEYLKCLCFLIKQPFICSSREEILNFNVIPLLFTILKDRTEVNEITLKNQAIVLSSLKSRYMFEDSQKCILLKNGIVDILSEILDEIVGSDLTIDTSHRFKSKKGYSYKSWAANMDSLVTRMMHERYYEPYTKRCLSPSSDTSSGPASCNSPCNPSIGLSDTDVFDNESSDSDNYSPVCSDTEEESHSLPNGLADVADECESEKSEEYSHSEPIDSLRTRQRSVSSLKKQLSYEVVDLIKSFAIMRPIPMELSSSNLLIKLLKSFLPSNKSCFARETLHVIKMITQSPKFLLGLMQTDFIVATHKFVSTEHGSNCVICVNLHKLGQTILLQLTKLVEKGCGQGDIAHLLYRASPSVKEKLVPVIPFIANSKKVLNNLFITCGGLDIMIQLIRKNIDVQKSCISGLCVLATKIGIKNPAASFNETSDKFIDLPIDIQDYEVEKNCVTVVRFILDDGTCIEADREFLSQKSDYFNRLLYGEFKESEENEIHLSNVCSKSLKLLLMLLQYDLSSTDIHKINVDLDILLDVIVLTDRYIMEDLCVCLTTSVQYFKLLPSTIPKIYQWSLESRTNILRVESVAYALVACINDNERLGMFENLMQLGYSEQLADDVQQLLIRFFHS